MEVLTALRIVNGLAWLAVLIYMTPSLWDMWNKRARHGDPARLVCAGFAVLMIGFVGRWLFFPAVAEAWYALYILSIVWALFTILAARSYGRGPLA